MRIFRSLLLVLGSLVLAAHAVAGPNAGGVLVVHYEPILNPTCDPIPYCGKSTLTTCEAAVVHTEQITCDAGLYVFASFPEGSSPRLSAVAFGAEWSDLEGGLLVRDVCGDTEEPGAAWPLENTGTVVRWNTPQTDPLVEVYVFFPYSYAGEPATATLTPHPTLGGVFEDDSAVQDAVADYGVYGFLTDGHRACAVATSGVPEPPSTRHTTWGRVRALFSEASR